MPASPIPPALPLSIQHEALSNTLDEVVAHSFDFSIQAEALNNVLDEPSKDENPLEKPKEVSLFNNSTSSSIESVSDIFNELFSQLEAYMRNAPEMDCIFIRRRIAEIKSGMRSINKQFEGLLITGSRLENFLVNRQNVNNISN